jgi:hypothetical protein
MKWTKIVMIALLLLILFQVTFPRTSGYADLVTKSSSGAPGDLFKLKHKLDCVAGGFNKDSAFYSKSLTPGGLCGDMDFVRNQERDYAIVGGHGGSLLAA